MARRLTLADEKLGHAGPVIGERIDAGETLADKLFLEPEPAVARDDEDLGEKVAVPVGALSAEPQFDRSFRRQGSRDASLASSTSGQGSSPRQPSGGIGALAPISFTVLPSASLRVSPSSTEATAAVSGGGRSQADARGETAVASQATPAQATHLAALMTMTHLRDEELTMHKRLGERSQYRK